MKKARRQPGFRIATPGAARTPLSKDGHRWCTYSIPARQRVSPEQDPKLCRQFGSSVRHSLPACHAQRGLACMRISHTAMMLRVLSIRTRLFADSCIACCGISKPFRNVFCHCHSVSIGATFLYAHGRECERHRTYPHDGIGKYADGRRRREPDFPAGFREFPFQITVHADGPCLWRRRGEDGPGRPGMRGR